MRLPRSVGLGEQHEGGSRDVCAAPEIIDRGKGFIHSRGDEGGGMGIGKPADHAQAEPDGEAVFTPVGSNVQSQREAFTQTGRTSTPWSRASRTI